MSLTADIDLKDLVRTIPDYPKPGIMFRDITTLLGHANGLRACIERLVAPFTNRRIESVAGIEARGFILGGAVADRLRCGFVPIRKKGKLPAKAIGQEYELEYGIDIIEIHEDALKPRRAGAARRRSHRHRRHGGGCGEITAQAECGGGRRGLRHRPAGPRRLYPPRQARGRVPHADDVRGRLRRAVASPLPLWGERFPPRSCARSMRKSHGGKGEG